MVAAHQMTPGMTIAIGGVFYRVESCVKVTVAKGTPFIKAKLRNVATDEVEEKNFKPNQNLDDVSLAERNLEFLYLEGKDYLFLDIATLDQVFVSLDVIGDKIDYLKEGIRLKATFYGEKIFSVELPQFLELTVASLDDIKAKGSNSASKLASLETGARIEVPPFVEVGDIIKVDTKSQEYIQRV